MTVPPEPRSARPALPANESTAPREPRWGRLYVVVAGLLVAETLVFWLLGVWAS